MTERMKDIRQYVLCLLEKAGISITPEEAGKIEYCDYGLGLFDRIGTSILTYVNTARVCAKEILMLPGQICPEHLHPALDGYAGKEETFRCRWGDVYLYVPGEPAEKPAGHVPDEYLPYFTVWHELHLFPGQQYTLKEQTLHWFQAGAQGAVVSEFSTPSFDDTDIFTAPQIIRKGYYL